MKLDLTNKLSNARPVLEIKGHAFEVDHTKNAMLAFDEKMDSLPKKGSVALLYEEGVRHFLGEDAAETLNGMALSIHDWQTIFIGIMALVNEIDYDEAEARFLGSSNE